MRKQVARTIRLAGALLVIGAVVKELRTPADERTWHGTVAGVPYDFRPPTADRVRAAWWDPDNPALFTPHAFGVGWSVNLARLVGLAHRRRPAGG